MHHLLATAFCSAALLTTSLAGAADLTIRIDDVRSDDGTVMLALYNSAGGFLKHAMGSADAKAAKGSTTIVVKDLPAGPYAFAIYHDANGNGKMDANMMGMPTEDYAFSNNALGKMGPPKFDDAMFTLPATGLNATVSLKH